MSFFKKIFKSVKRAVSDIGGLFESVLDPGAATARALKEGQRSAERQARAIREREEAETQAARRRREQALRATLSPQPSLFDVLGGSQNNRGTLG